MSPIGSPFRAEMRATVALAVPLAGANLASMVMGLTNAIMVGRLGGNALAAAGLGAGIYFTTVMVCQGVLLAVAPLAAHALGAGDRSTAARTSGAGLLLAAALAIPVRPLPTRASRTGKAPPSPADPAAPALLLATSGTTAEPKFVTHTQLTLAHALVSYESLRSHADPQPAMLVCTPLSHASGFAATFLGLQFGRRVRLLPAFDAADCLTAIETDRCSWVLGAPFMFAQMLSSQQSRPRDLSSLRFCVAVGDVCPGDLRLRFRRFSTNCSAETSEGCVVEDLALALLRDTDIP